MTSKLEACRELFRKITAANSRIDMDGSDEVTPLVEQLQQVCEHPETTAYDLTKAVCTYCGKVFKERGT